MKQSIKRQFASIVIILILIPIMASLFLNNTFLQQFYQKNRENALNDAYTMIQNALGEKTVSESWGVELEELCNKYDISFIILDVNSQLLLTNSEAEGLKKSLFDNIIGKDEQILEILDKQDEYQIQIIEESATKFKYIEMWGDLDNGYIFLMRIALEGIVGSVEVANQFLLYIGIFVTIISAIIAWITAAKLTKPILELADISEQMGKLNFKAKYYGKSKNEIAILGQNMNLLSEKLEETISELKSANNALQKDIEKYSQIEAMRTEFLANVSHELKTPLALVQGYAEGLIEGISSDEESRNYYCEVILDETHKMNEMVKKLLTLNEIEFGNSKVDFERINVIDLIKSCLQSVYILCKEKNITVKVNQEQAIYVWGDRFRVEEVFRNYMTNAIHHAEFEKMIEVNINKVDGKACISVFNSGIPIPEDSISQIWGKFYKVDKARTRKYGGNGIGLSIVKAEMESMNQKYGVTNYENGVKFWFELELAEDE